MARNNTSCSFIARSLYSDRGAHFWLTPKSGGKVDYDPPTQVGRGIRTLEGANKFLNDHYIAEFNRRFTVPAAELGTAFLSCRHRNLEVFAVLSASNGRPPIFYLAHVLWRHRDTQLLSIPPPPIQRILLPVVLIIGRILGKYNGSSWPGSPESCQGAPLVASNAKSPIFSALEDSTNDV